MIELSWIINHNEYIWVSLSFQFSVSLTAVGFHWDLWNTRRPSPPFAPPQLPPLQQVTTFHWRSLRVFGQKFGHFQKCESDQNRKHIKSWWFQVWFSKFELAIGSRMSGWSKSCLFELPKNRGCILGIIRTFLTLDERVTQTWYVKWARLWSPQRLVLFDFGLIMSIVAEGTENPWSPIESHGAKPSGIR